MLRWIWLAISVAALVSLWGVNPEYAFVGALAVLIINFATFCLLYDQPLVRARDRIAAYIQTLHPNSELAQRLSTVKAKVTEEDRDLGSTPMTIANHISGVAAAIMLLWGLSIRLL